MHKASRWQTVQLGIEKKRIKTETYQKDPLNIRHCYNGHSWCSSCIRIHTQKQMCWLTVSCLSLPQRTSFQQINPWFVKQTIVVVSRRSHGFSHVICFVVISVQDLGDLEFCGPFPCRLLIASVRTTRQLASFTFVTIQFEVDGPKDLSIRSRVCSQHHSSAEVVLVLRRGRNTYDNRLLHLHQREDRLQIERRWNIFSFVQDQQCTSVNTAQCV